MTARRLGTVLFAMFGVEIFFFLILGDELMLEESRPSNWPLQVAVHRPRPRAAALLKGRRNTWSEWSCFACILEGTQKKNLISSSINGVC